MNQQYEGAGLPRVERAGEVGDEVEPVAGADDRRAHRRQGSAVEFRPGAAEGPERLARRS